MKCTIWDDRKPIATIDMNPVCGEHFCEHCGDCLACYGDDGCYRNDCNEHYWCMELDEFEDEIEIFFRRA